MCRKREHKPAFSGPILFFAPFSLSSPPSLPLLCTGGRRSILSAIVSLLFVSFSSSSTDGPCCCSWAVRRQLPALLVTHLCSPWRCSSAPRRRPDTRRRQALRGCCDAAYELKGPLAKIRRITYDIYAQPFRQPQPKTRPATPVSSGAAQIAGCRRRPQRCSSCLACRRKHEALVQVCSLETRTYPALVFRKRTRNDTRQPLRAKPHSLVSRPRLCPSAGRGTDASAEATGIRGRREYRACCLSLAASVSLSGTRPSFVRWWHTAVRTPRPFPTGGLVLASASR